MRMPIAILTLFSNRDPDATPLRAAAAQRPPGQPVRAVAKPTFRRGGRTTIFQRRGLDPETLGPVQKTVVARGQARPGSARGPGAHWSVLRSAREHKASPEAL